MNPPTTPARTRPIPHAAVLARLLHRSRRGNRGRPVHGVVDDGPAPSPSLLRRRVGIAGRVRLGGAHHRDGSTSEADDWREMLACLEARQASGKRVSTGLMRRVRAVKAAIATRHYNRTRVTPANPQRRTSTG
jgi:hypothetical protein